MTLLPRCPDRSLGAAPWSPRSLVEGAPDLPHPEDRERTALALGHSSAVPYSTGTIMAMRNASARQNANPGQSNTLRSLLDSRSAEGRRMSLDEAVAVIVPVCVDLNERHARGE